ncbi:hypothetical protein D917_02506 [Trichinella nativa]|uniref:Uncharacterized protein n=1 Tax=Trichinella nativa TaxID=6335 RepID=A0A1Y3EHY6_9BILA|nr:hypothetical protein D917_02506 [Trichinella nativa]
MSRQRCPPLRAFSLDRFVQITAAEQAEIPIPSRLSSTFSFQFGTTEKAPFLQRKFSRKKASQETNRSPRDARRVMILERPGLDKPLHPGSKKRPTVGKQPVTDVSCFGHYKTCLRIATFTSAKVAGFLLWFVSKISLNTLTTPPGDAKQFKLKL